MSAAPIITPPAADLHAADEAARAMRSAWKDAGTLPDQIFKESAGVVVKASEEEMRRTRTIPFVVSTPTPDRAWGGGDVVVPTGGRFENFLKSPVILWSHSHFTPPIAKGLNVRADAAGVYMDKQFMEREINPFADSIFEMLVRGFLNACSIGFRPIKYYWNEERGSWAMDFIEWELLESSICAVGMNPDALQVARSVGVDLAPLRDFAERVLDEELQRGGDEVQKRLHERFIKGAGSKGSSILTAPIKIELSGELLTSLQTAERRVGELLTQIQTLETKFQAAGGGQNNTAQEAGHTTPSEAKAAAAPSKDGAFLLITEE